MTYKPFITPMVRYVDDRGSVYCVVDEMVHGKLIPPIQRTYTVTNWKAGTIRAWHAHDHAWTGMHVIGGAAKLVARPILDKGQKTSSDELITTLSEHNPGILWVPPGYFNGSMSLQDNTTILVFSTLTFEQVKQDDVREELSSNDYDRYFKVKPR